MMRILELESHSEVATHREGFAQTRDCLQRRVNASSEEFLKYINLTVEYQDELSLMKSGVRHRQSLESEIARLKKEVQNAKQDLEVIGLTNDSTKGTRNSSNRKEMTEEKYKAVRSHRSEKRRAVSAHFDSL